MSLPKQLIYIIFTACTTAYCPQPLKNKFCIIKYKNINDSNFATFKKKMAIDNRGYKAYNSMILKNKIILNYNSTSF